MIRICIDDASYTLPRKSSVRGKELWTPQQKIKRGRSMEQCTQIQAIKMAASISPRLQHSEKWREEPTTLTRTQHLENETHIVLKERFLWTYRLDQSAEEAFDWQGRSPLKIKSSLHYSCYLKEEKINE